MRVGRNIKMFFAVLAGSDLREPLFYKKSSLGTPERQRKAFFEKRVLWPWQALAVKATDGGEVYFSAASRERTR